MEAIKLIENAEQLPREVSPGLQKHHSSPWNTMVQNVENVEQVIQELTFFFRKHYEMPSGIDHETSDPVRPTPPPPHGSARVNLLPRAPLHGRSS